MHHDTCKRDQIKQTYIVIYSTPVNPVIYTHYNIIGTLCIIKYSLKNNISNQKKTLLTYEEHDGG